MMSIPFFFHADAVTGALVTLDEANSRHAMQVLRLQAGEPVHLTNGAGMRYTGVVAEGTKKTCVVRIDSEALMPPSALRRVAVAISPVKNTSRFEWFLEKAGELGVADIFPVITRRTVREHFRMERMQQICVSAMLQSGQTWLTRLHAPTPFSTLMENDAARAYHHKWIAHCADYEKHALLKVLQPGMKDSMLLIGPEGDFTTEEIFDATEKGFVPVSLGPTRLRTETAGVIGAALMCLG